MNLVAGIEASPEEKLVTIYSIGYTKIIPHLIEALHEFYDKSQGHHAARADLKADNGYLREKLRAAGGHE